jgi:APA family basic amino acid/polyamine antiporter
MSLCGALTFAELGGMLPEAGGEYVYLRTAYGELWGFLDGWMRFVVASGGIAALGIGFATFLSAVVPLEGVWAQRTLHLLGRDVPWQLGLKEMVGVAVVLLFGVLNCIGVRFGGGLQTVLTAAKVTGILIIVAGAFFISKAGSFANFNAPSGASAVISGMSGAKGFGAAVLSALWACDGWAFMPMVAGEVRNPGRNVPRALIAGLLLRAAVR